MTYKKICYFLFALFCVSPGLNSLAEKTGSSPVLVLLEKNSTGTSYHVDSKDVTPNSLRGIAEAFEEHGSDIHYPVVVVVDDRLPIETIGEARGLVGKVGFVNVRYFLLNSHTRKMSEITFGRVYLFPDAIKSGLQPR